MTDSNDIVDAIAASPKYKNVDRRTIERVVHDAVKRYGLKKAADPAKRLLHQIWGIYYDPAKLKKADMKSHDIDELLKLHQSTKERLPILREFYDKIFAITNQPLTIVDYACGMNPLAFYTLGYSFPMQYTARDIDDATVDLLNRLFGELGVSNRFVVTTGDLLLDEPTPADVAFLLKVLPCLELQQKGISRDIINKQTARYVVVSYPVKSVSGREKGMADFYADQFNAMAASEKWHVTPLTFTSEIVFVIDKSPVQ